MSRRVVITGAGVVSPLGNSRSSLWEALLAGRSGIERLRSVPTAALPTPFGAEAWQFTGDIENFGPLEKTQQRNIKKGLKLMCREIQMGVAVAQLSLAEAGLAPGSYDPDRTGCVYGCDYIMTLPDEFAAGIGKCLDADRRFDFTRWGDQGLPQVQPLWLLKYLPNMPASHIAIYNDLRGPNNSLTMREASANLAAAEAYLTIVRGHADVIVAGATGSRIHPMRTVHVVLQEELAPAAADDSPLPRPFDLHRRGMVIGEGAAAVVLEELDYAQRRGATILGEVIGFGSSAVQDRHGVGDLSTALRNVMTQALRSAGLTPDDVGHLHAHGLATRRSDREEAAAIAAVFGGRTRPAPVVAAKSYFGNLGAGSGLIELIASLEALRAGRLFATLGYDTPDPECPIAVVRGGDEPAGTTALNVNVTPQGQASALLVKRWDGA